MSNFMSINSKTQMKLLFENSQTTKFTKEPVPERRHDVYNQNSTCPHPKHNNAKRYRGKLY